MSGTAFFDNLWKEALHVRAAAVRLSALQDAGYALPMCVASPDVNLAEIFFCENSCHLTRSRMTSSRRGQRHVRGRGVAGCIIESLFTVTRPVRSLVVLSGSWYLQYRNRCPFLE